MRRAGYNSDSISLKYGPAGNRVWKQSVASGQTTTRKYIVDIVGDLPVVLLEIDTDKDEYAVEYIYANGQIIAHREYEDGYLSSYGINFYIHDRTGSVRILARSGVVANRYAYDPFGELFDSEVDYGGPVDDPFRFTGQWFDTEIEQYYLRARMYDPHIARFTSRDPVLGKFQEPLALHKYLYCGNDPINKVDPLGLWVYYMTFTASASLGYSGMVQAGFVWNNKGDVGIITIESEWGVGSPAISGGISLGIIPTTENILDLRGPGWAGGGEVGIGSIFGAGAQYIGSESELYSGIEFNAGVGLTYPKGQLHGYKTFTRVVPIRSETLTFEDIVGRSAGEAFYSSQTYGGCRIIMDFMAMTGVDMMAAVQ